MIKEPFFNLYSKKILFIFLYIQLSAT